MTLEEIIDSFTMRENEKRRNYMEKIMITPRRSVQAFAWRLS
jgi:hypothetical protein